MEAGEPHNPAASVFVGGGRSAKKQTPTCCWLVACLQRMYDAKSGRTRHMHVHAHAQCSAASWPGQPEAEYGRKIDAYKDSIVIDGELREGNILRVGRLAMVFQTADETQTHAWNNSTRSWEELDNSYRNPTKRGLRIANKLATVDLMELPLPAATEAN